MPTTFCFVFLFAKFCFADSETLRQNEFLHWRVGPKKPLGTTHAIYKQSTSNASNNFKGRYIPPLGALQTALVVKNPPASAGDVRDAGSIPGSGRSPGGGSGNPLQCSCLENPVDRSRWATVHRASKSRTKRKQFSAEARTSLC